MIQKIRLRRFFQLMEWSGVRSRLIEQAFESIEQYMILDIVQYGHPALRAKGRRIEVVDEKIRDLASDMLETMEDADGVGLAAQQVGMPLQLFVVDIGGVSGRPSSMWLGGESVDPNEHMPLVVVNPEIENSGSPCSGTEGCLSFPGIQADIDRPSRVRLRATDLDGNAIDLEAEGLLARAIQHELDHVRGVLFIDRMSMQDRKRLADELEELAAAGGA
jgi:peptide deformylase